MASLEGLPPGSAIHSPVRTTRRTGDLYASVPTEGGAASSERCATAPSHPGSQRSTSRLGMLPGDEFQAPHGALLPGSYPGSQRSTSRLGQVPEGLDPSFDALALSRVAGSAGSSASADVPLGYGAVDDDDAVMLGDSAAPHGTSADRIIEAGAAAVALAAQEDAMAAAIAGSAATRVSSSHSRLSDARGASAVGPGSSSGGAAGDVRLATKRLSSSLNVRLVSREFPADASAMGSVEEASAAPHLPTPPAGAMPAAVALSAGEFEPLGGQGGDDLDSAESIDGASPMQRFGCIFRVMDDDHMFHCTDKRSFGLLDSFSDWSRCR